MDNNSLIKKLQSIVGKDNVLHSEAERYCYAYDATNSNEKLEIPECIVLAENTAQISEIMKLANTNKIPVVVRGAGTNLAGCCFTPQGGILLHLSKMNQILKIDKNNMTCKVQPGVIVGELQDEVKKLGLFYPPDPSNLKVSTMGGSIGLSSGGPRTFKYGTTKDYVIDLEVVLADGRIIHTGAQTAKNVVGYNLTQLFVGSEGTLGIVTEATIKLISLPETNRVILAYFDSLKDCANAVGGIISNQLTPAVIDLLDINTLQTIEKFCPSGLLTDKEAALLIEVDGFEADIEMQQDKVAKICKEFGASAIVVAKTKEEEEKIWTARRSAFGSCAKIAPDVLTEDVVVPRTLIPELVTGIREIFNRYNLTACIMGHAGDGNIHPNVALDLRNETDATNFHKAKDELFKLALRLGGTLSGEHGIGSEKAPYMKDALDPVVLEYMKNIKKLFDPHNILNPDKIFV